jgi:hypothetical protein
MRRLDLKLNRRKELFRHRRFNLQATKAAIALSTAAKSAIA